MRRVLKSILPGHEAVRDNRWLRPFAGTLLHPRLWHLNRHSAAGGVAAGLFACLIPGPLQMLGAAALAVLARVNLPLAILGTLVSNPLTIVPLYWGAFELGRRLVGDGGARFSAPPAFSWSNVGPWSSAIIDWGVSLGQPLAVGLLALGLLMAGAGYVLVAVAWRAWLVWHWRARARRRRPHSAQS